MKYKKSILLAFVLSSLSPWALADAYVGGGFGSSSVDQDGFEDSDTYKVYGGGRFGNFGFELAYVNFDGFALSSNSASTVSGDGFEASGVGYLPLGKSVDLFGKIGALAWDLNATTAGTSFSASESDVSLAYGVGVQYKPIDNLSLRLEYQKYVDVSDADLSALSVGVAYHF